jgi:hypothetical protein
MHSRTQREEASNTFAERRTCTVSDESPLDVRAIDARDAMKHDPRT